MIFVSFIVFGTGTRFGHPSNSLLLNGRTKSEVDQVPGSTHWGQRTIHQTHNLHREPTYGEDASVELWQTHQLISVKFWLLVSTQLKNISQNGNLPQIGVKIKKMKPPPSILYTLLTKFYRTHLGWLWAKTIQQYHVIHSSRNHPSHRAENGMNINKCLLKPMSQPPPRKKIKNIHLYTVDGSEIRHENQLRLVVDSIIYRIFYIP